MQQFRVKGFKVERFRSRGLGVLHLGIQALIKGFIVCGFLALLPSQRTQDQASGKVGTETTPPCAARYEIFCA